MKILNWLENKFISYTNPKNSNKLFVSLEILVALAVGYQVSQKSAFIKNLSLLNDLEKVRHHTQKNKARNSKNIKKVDLPYHLTKPLDNKVYKNRNAKSYLDVKCTKNINTYK